MKIETLGYTKEDYQRLLSHLQRLRDEYSDEIPGYIVHSNDEDNRYKVRKAWWASLGATLRILVREELITDPNLISAIESFLGNPTGELTTAEDIERANKLLELLLGAE